MSNYPDPCLACERTSCPKNCLAWKTRYLYRQAQINAYAKHHGIVPGAPEYKPGKNPCRIAPEMRYAPASARPGPRGGMSASKEQKTRWRVANERYTMEEEG